MNILLIPDKFKESLTAEQVINALRSGVHNSVPQAHIESLKASDGGDGFLGAVAQYVDCEEIDSIAVDPLGREIKTFFLYDPQKQTAYIEMAKTAGLELLNEAEKSAWTTTTWGTGLQIKQAMDVGATSIYVGLGGSATNDGGMGMAAALGFVFKDEHGKVLDPMGSSLIDIETIDPPKKWNGVKSCSIIAVHDVENPLFGKNGAAHIYAAQKGATHEEINALDKGLMHLDAKAQQYLDKENAFDPGAGAAGGMGYGLSTFLDATAISGITFIMELAKVDQLLEQRDFDFIITGEGKFDKQTLNGKLIHGVVTLGAKYDIPIIVVCGRTEIDPIRSIDLGLHKIIEVMDHSKPLSYNMEHAAALIKQKVGAYFSQLDLKAGNAIQ